MPRFYFHPWDSDGLSRDELGLDLPDVKAAYLEADRAVNGLAQEFLARGQNPRDYAFEIANAAGALALDLPFAETLDRITGRQAPPLSRSTRLAIARAERMMRLTSEVTEQARITTENLRRAQDLLKSLGQSDRARRRT